MRSAAGKHNGSSIAGTGAAGRSAVPVAADHGFRRTLDGEADWRAIAAAAAPSERVSLLARLARRELLVVTAGGRARLRRWLDRAWARPTDDDSAEPIEIDSPARPASTVTRALVPDHRRCPCRVPPAVRTPSSRRPTFSRWEGGSVAGHRRPSPRRACVQFGVDGESVGEVLGITLHEVAHRWHSPTLTPACTRRLCTPLRSS